MNTRCFSIRHLKQTAPLGSNPTVPASGTAPSVRQLLAFQRGFPTSWIGQGLATKLRGVVARLKGAGCQGPPLADNSTVPHQYRLAAARRLGAQRDPTLGSYLRATKCSNSSFCGSCKRRQTFCGSGSRWSARVELSDLYKCLQDCPTSRLCTYQQAECTITAS